MTDRLYAFVLRGLLAEHALRVTEAKFAVSEDRPLQDIQQSLSTELIEPEFVNPSRRMAEVYTTIAAFERSVRDLVKGVLQDKYGEEWWTKGVSDKIRARAESRELEEAKFRWHSSRGTDHMEYIELGDLGNIIAQNWEQFEAHFHSQTWAKNVFDVIEKSRNVIMHSGDLEDHDISRLGVFIRDWVKQVG